MSLETEVPKTYNACFVLKETEFKTSSLWGYIFLSCNIFSVKFTYIRLHLMSKCFLPARECISSKLMCSKLYNLLRKKFLLAQLWSPIPPLPKIKTHLSATIRALALQDRKLWTQPFKNWDGKAVCGMHLLKFKQVNNLLHQTRNGLGEKTPATTVDN